MLAIVVNKIDNVATALSEIMAGSIPAVLVLDKDAYVRMRETIPMGHKFAIRIIEKEVIKYGEIIGVATCTIEAGEYVHTHNVKSLRGRGDLLDSTISDEEAEI